MNWKEKDGYLVKNFELSGFKEITDALTTIADKADAMQHHPDVDIYGYKNVRFKLKTHDEDKITDKDHKMAKEIDEVMR